MASKIWMIIFVVLVLLSGARTLPTCIDYLTSRSSASGSTDDASKTPLPESKDCYSITYDLASGEVSDNPTKYSYFSPTFTLNNPKKQGYRFVGWTGTGLSEPRQTVTIKQGSSGDLEFFANYSELLSAPTIALDVRSSDDVYVTWSEVPNATAYVLNINGNDVTQTTATFIKFEARLLSASETLIKVKATCDNGTIESAYSNILTYTVQQSLTAPTLTLANNKMTFNKVENAVRYMLVVGDCDLTFLATTKSYPAITSDDNKIYIDLTVADDSIQDGLLFAPENQKYINSSSHSVEIHVIALPSLNSTVVPGTSNSVTYNYSFASTFIDMQFAIKTMNKTQFESAYPNVGYDSSKNAYLCVLLPESMFSSWSEVELNTYSVLKIQVYKDGELVYTSKGLSLAGYRCYHFSDLGDLEGGTYQIKMLLTDDNQRYLEHAQTFNFDYVSNKVVTFLAQA